MFSTLLVEIIVTLIRLEDFYEDSEAAEAFADALWLKECRPRLVIHFGETFTAQLSRSPADLRRVLNLFEYVASMGDCDCDCEDCRDE